MPLLYIRFFDRARSLQRPLRAICHRANALASLQDQATRT